MKPTIRTWPARPGRVYAVLDAYPHRCFEVHGKLMTELRVRLREGASMSAVFVELCEAALRGDPRVRQVLHPYPFMHEAARAP